MRVTIHQPEFAPWLGFFHKVGLADTLILLDDVQFEKNYFQNRNRVRTSAGTAWITVPVEHSGLGTTIDHIRIARSANPNWGRTMERTLSLAYGRAPYFEEPFEEFLLLLRAAGDSLVTLNIPLLQWLLREFGIGKHVVRSSSFGVDSKGSKRILDLCLAVGASTYVSGVSGREYLNLEAFERAGIAVEFQEFRHPVYPQLYPGFVPRISALEALFLFGPGGRRLLGADWAERLDTILA